MQVLRGLNGCGGHLFNIIIIVIIIVIVIVIIINVIAIVVVIAVVIVIVIGGFSHWIIPNNKTGT